MPVDVVSNLVATVPGGLATVIFLGGPFMGAVVFGLWRSVWAALAAPAIAIVAVLLIEQQSYYLMLLFVFVGLGGAAIGLMLKKRMQGS